MMTRIRKTMLWMATLCAAIGVAFIVAFLQSRQPHGDLLVDATLAASLAAAALFASVVFVCLDSLRRPQTRAPSLNPPTVGRAAAAPVPVHALLQERQDVLQERLHVDEARVCSQAQAPCTCWSFCGSDTESPAGASPLPAGAVQTSPAKPRTVQRSGIANCHLPTAVEPAAGAGGAG